MTTCGLQQPVHLSLSRVDVFKDSSVSHVACGRTSSLSWLNAIPLGDGHICLLIQKLLMDSVCFPLSAAVNLHR